MQICPEIWRSISIQIRIHFQRRARDRLETSLHLIIHASDRASPPDAKKENKHNYKYIQIQREIQIDMYANINTGIGLENVQGLIADWGREKCHLQRPLVYTGVYSCLQVNRQWHFNAQEIHRNCQLQCSVYGAVNCVLAYSDGV